MKIRDQAPRLCLVIYDFEPQIMLSKCLTFQSIWDYVHHYSDCEIWISS